MVMCLGVRCRFVYGPHDATATHSLSLASVKSKIGFTFLIPTHPGSPGRRQQVLVWHSRSVSFIARRKLLYVEPG